MNIGLKICAALSWLVATAGFLFGLLVFVAHGCLNSSQPYDRSEVVMSLVLPVCATGIATVVWCFDASLGSPWRCVPWVLPSFVVVVLTLLVAIIGCFP